MGTDIEQKDSSCIKLDTVASGIPPKWISNISFGINLKAFNLPCEVYDKGDKGI